MTMEISATRRETVAFGTGEDVNLPGVSWAAVLAGAAGAAALSYALVILGFGLGLSSVSPWAAAGASATTIGVATILWLTLTQIAASSLGGYIAGRLRVKWPTVHTDEVYFRDTAHGFLAWALATVIVAALFAIGTGIAGTTAAVTAEPGAVGDAADAAAAVSQRALDAAANFSIFTAISLLVGGFIGAVAGGLGGYHRDAV